MFTRLNEANLYRADLEGATLMSGDLAGGRPQLRRPAVDKVLGCQPVVGKPEGSKPLESQPVVDKHHAGAGLQRFSTWRGCLPPRGLAQELARSSEHIDRTTAARPAPYIVPPGS